jgi:hypothetical protein
MAHFREASRLAVSPNIAESMSDEKRYVPLENLVGPYTFQIDMFQRRLQVGNQSFGDFAPYESNQMKRAVAFNYKKLMDMFIRTFEELFYQGDDSKRKIEAKNVYLVCRTKDREDHSAWIREQTDLAAAYGKIESFVFFIEVCRRDDTVDEGLAMNLSDLDDIVQRTFIQIGAERRPTGDEHEIKRRKVTATKVHANANCQQLGTYDHTQESCDLSGIMSSPVDWGRVVHAAVAPVAVCINRDCKANLSDLEYAPSRMFSAKSVYDAAVDEGSAAPDRVPREFVTYHEASRQTCLDLCAGLSFCLEPPQLRLESFRLVRLPDIRQTDQADVVPYPDDATLLRAAGVDLDNTVQIRGVSGFTVARDKLAPSLAALDEWCASTTFSMDAKRKRRWDWQGRALIVYKSIVYGPRGAIGHSVKAMVRLWEMETEKDRPCGAVGILVPPVRLEVFPNLDAQQNYLANLYVFAEKAGVFCQHSNFLGMLIDSRYACRKGSGMKYPPPHTILYGSPGSGKSYCLEMVKLCTQGDSQPVFAKWVDSASALNWAVVNEEDPDNPDTSQAQVVILWDEVPAVRLGAGDKRKGEGSDEVSRMKSMCTKPELTYERNVEVKRADGTVGRGLEKASITNECVFFGAMNRHPMDVNPAFHRRFQFKVALANERADGVTLEDAKAVSNTADPFAAAWVDALRFNAKMHMVVAGAEYAGIILPPCLRVFDRLSAVFETEVRKITTVKHLTDRISNARERLRLFTRMVAIFETYQQGPPKVLSFDELVSRLPDVERRSVAGERITLAMLSGLEDVTFPLMHKIVLQSVLQRWGENGTLDQYRANGFRDQVPGLYAKMPLEKRAAYRQKKDESMVECGVRVLMEHVKMNINKSAGAYKLEGAMELAKSAIVELTTIQDPEHPILVFDEDVVGDAAEQGGGGDLAVYVSLERMRNLHVTLADIIRKLSKPGTQLTMIPHHVTGTSAILPQFPMAIEDGTAEGDIEDGALFATRCASTFHRVEQAYSPMHAKKATTAHKFPRTLIDAIAL